VIVISDVAVGEKSLSRSGKAESASNTTDTHERNISSDIAHRLALMTQGNSPTSISAIET
jgi:hypothetical protein